MHVALTFKNRRTAGCSSLLARGPMPDNNHSPETGGTYNEFMYNTSE